MPDIADARADFRAATRRAEEAAGITRDADGNEQYAEETPVAIPELEGAVPVQASDQPLEPEAVQPPEEPAAVTPETEAPAAPLSTEDLQQRLAAAEARLEEKDSFIGRQSGEVGELRKAIEEMQKQINAPPAPATPAAIQITQELIDNNPGAAVQAAFDQRNQAALEVAFEAWKDPVMGDPFAAAMWINDRKLEQQQVAFEQQLAERDKKFETVTAPIAESAAEAADQRQWTAAFDEVKGKHPDIFAVDPATGASTAERLITAAGTQPEYEAFKGMLQTGDAKTKAAALSALYALDRVGNPQALQAQLAEGAQEAAAEAAAALATAGAVTGQRTAGQPAEQTTVEQQEQQQYISRMKDRPSLARGWTGRRS
jgi:hypothetical protein